MNPYVGVGTGGGGMGSGGMGSGGRGSLPQLHADGGSRSTDASPRVSPREGAAASAPASKWSAPMHTNLQAGHAVFDLNGNEMKATSGGMMPVAVFGGTAAAAPGGVAPTVGRL